jgi:CheY-like chemotaxis protein/HPt (histidine-containing phosphotransfer) domain-containing protein
MREKEGLRDVRIILLTSMGSLGDGRRCREIGIQGYLTKPVGQEELREAVVAVMSKGGEEEENRRWSLVSRHSLAEERTGGALQILVAEDYPTIQEILLMHLRSAGYEVDLAENGEQAVEAFRRKHYDLILMDIQMPEMDGYEATRAIRDLEKDRQGKGAEGERALRVPIVAITAHAAKEDMEKCFAAGMDGYLPKPIKRRVLLDAVRKVGAAKKAPDRPSASPPEDGDDLRTLDLTQILDEFQGREGFLFGAIERFLRDVRGQIEQMRRAVGEGDAKTVVNEAHSGKGAAKFLTAERLAETAFELESAGRSDNLAAAPRLLDLLEKEMRRIEELAERERKRT